MAKRLGWVERTLIGDNGHNRRFISWSEDIIWCMGFILGFLEQEDRRRKDQEIKEQMEFLMQKLRNHKENLVQLKEEL